VIASIASFLKSNLNSGEFLARFSGEEFIIIITNKKLSDTYTRFEKLRLDLTKNYASKLTCCFGIVELKIADEPKDVLSRASKAVLKAKKSGKNMVIALP